MSLTDEQKAIAKVQAQGCRRWMSLIILAPVLLCAILTILAPNIREYLVKREANEQCQQLAPQSEPVSNSTVFEDDTFVGSTVISADNLEQMVRLGETTFDTTIPSRDYSSAVLHPNGDTVIYVSYRSGEATNFFICDGDNALGAFSADENAGDLVFNRDGSLFAVGDAESVRVFDGVNIEPHETINIRDIEEASYVDSLAFHPTEPLLFFTVENALFVYDTETFSQLLQRQFSGTSNKEIGFSADGRLVYLVDSGDNAEASVWGIGE